MVSWDFICRPTNAGGLGILDAQTMNMVLLTKWVAMLMSPREDLITHVLKENYGRGLNWERYAVHIQGASPFWQGLTLIFPPVHNFFIAQLGDGSTFQYLTND